MKNREGGFLISKVKQISSRVFDKKLKNYDITDLNSAQGRIIFVLWKNDDRSISDLVTNTALSKTTLSSMLDRLEQAGHIKRALDKNDKRRTIISLTEKSKQLKKKYEDVSNEMIDLFYKGLSEEQIDEFERTLQHILNNLITYEREQK
ncbi:MarR family winged helix-turn-helix transcriptional regulator [Sporolactobacillus laevolacticus]|uniref:MarR family winged helix-turn-helix transcriptional regulator n=1 Tax=Sporolactobacillus laevolacticus TaxID=33018 RepID=UPI0025B4E4CA|nr:MarR family transcriptional regulator [Sporolactobacillus laevolacticus]MDN3956332.1 MarR family transcriptional regulator [Sporolactobacillus laevolacticus]